MENMIETCVGCHVCHIPTVAGGCTFRQDKMFIYEGHGTGWAPLRPPRRRGTEVVLGLLLYSGCAGRQFVVLGRNKFVVPGGQGWIGYKRGCVCLRAR